MRKILLLLIVLTVLGFYYFFNSDGLPILTAHELYTLYQKNEQVADSLYNGQTLQISGNVIRTQMNNKGQAVIYLDAGADQTIACTLSEEPDRLPMTGDHIKVKGLCAGLLFDVILKNCVIVSN
jgi:hypothetical protein